MANHWPAGSTRRGHLPADWSTVVVPRIMARDGRRCYLCGRLGADQVDHKRNGDDHRDSNLAAVHGWPCHARKTAQEGNAARRARHGAARHPGERHPGERP